MAAAPHTAGYAISALVVLLLALLPGLPIAYGLGRGAGWDLPTVLTASFAVQLAVVSATALAAHYLFLPLTFVLWASIALLAVLGAAALWPFREWRLPAVSWPALAFGAAGLGIGVAERTWFYQSADAFYHLAAVRSLLVTGRPMVTDPLYGTSLHILDPTSGVWHTVLALWTKVTGLDVVQLWAGAPAVGGALTLMAFWVLARRVSRFRLAATIATGAWFAIGLAADLRWFAYPNRLSLALAFVSLAALVALASERRRQHAVLAIAAGFATASMHLAAAEVVGAAGVLLLGVLVLAALARRSAEGSCDWRPVLALTGVGCAIGLLSAPLLLPRASVVGSSFMMQYGDEYLSKAVVQLPGGMLADVPGNLMQVGAITFAAAAVLAVFMAVTGIREDDTVTVAAAGIAALPLVLLADPPLTTALLRQSVYLTSRIALLLPFTAYLGVAWALAVPSESRRTRIAAAVLAVAVLAAAVVSQRPAIRNVWSPNARLSVWKTRVVDVRMLWGEDAVAAMGREFGARYPIVAGDPETTYYLSGVLPAAVVSVPIRHSPFAVEQTDGGQRRLDMIRLMRLDTEADRRRILAKWDASYVVVMKRAVSARTLAQMRTQTGLFRFVVEGPGVVLFAVRR